MSNYPKVSVVTITYGHEKYIKQTLEGVLMQEYPGEIEFIIANDNSPDATDQVVKDYFSSKYIPTNFIIKYTQHDFNRGMMPNFLWAMDQATGIYIALCEGDDYWTDPLKLQKQVAFLEENTDYGLVYTKCTRSDNGKIMGGRMAKDIIFYDNKICTLTTVFSHSIFENYISKADPLSKGWTIGDYPIWLWFYTRSKIKFLDFDSAVYRVLSESASHSKDNNKKILVYLSAFDIADYFSKEYFDRREYLNYVNSKLTYLFLVCFKNRSIHGLGYVISKMKLIKNKNLVNKLIVFISSILK